MVSSEKKKDGTIVSGPIPLPSPSVSREYLSQGEKMVQRGFDVAPNTVSEGISKDLPKKDGNWLAGIYNTIVDRIGSFAGGIASAEAMNPAVKIGKGVYTKFQEALAGTPAWDKEGKVAPMQTKIDEQKWREAVSGFVEKARSAKSSKEYERRRSQFDVFDGGVSMDDIKGMAFQAPSQVSDMALGALTGGASFLAQSWNDNAKDLEENPNAAKLTDNQKISYLYIQSLAQAALEKFSLDKITKNTGLTKKVQQKITSEVIDDFVSKGIKATGKEIEDAVIKKASSLVNKIKNVGIKAATGFITEGGTEGVQQMGSDAIKLITNKIAKNEVFNEDDIKDNFIKNAVNSSVMGGLMGGTLSGAGARLSNTNKSIRKQIAEMQSPEELKTVQNQINEQVEQGNITPEEAQAANIKAEDYAKIAAKIPSEIDSQKKYSIIGGIEQRNALQADIEKLNTEIGTIDESLQKDRKSQIELLEAKLEQVNDHINTIVSGESPEYVEKDGNYFKVIDGEEVKISKPYYELAKAAEEENNRKENQYNNEVVKEIDEYDAIDALTPEESKKVAYFTAEGRFEEANKIVEDKLNELKNKSNTKTQEIKIQEPTEEQIVDDVKNKRFATFTYKSEEEVPEQFKDKISSTGENTLPDGTVEKIVRVTVPQSIADYELSKTAEVKVTEEKEAISKVKDDNFNTPVLKSEASNFEVQYVPRKVVESAYENDVINKERTGGAQTLETIIKRGGYSIEELNKLLPNWRELAKKEVKPIELEKGVKFIEPKSPVSIPEEISNPIINKIKKGIQKLSDTAKVSVLKGKNFAKALDEAIKTGRVNLQSWGGFEKKGFEESPQWQKLIEDGSVKLNFDMKGLEGKPVVVINPDNMLTGAVLTKNGKPIIDGNGGINFVTKFGDVWASSDNATANTLAKYINEARAKDLAAGGDGTVHVVVTKGDLSKSLTSHSGAKAAMKVLEYLVDKKYISLADFRKALTDVGKKYNIDFDGRLDAKSIQDDIAKKFFGVTDSTFSKRGFFVQDIIDHLAKNSKSAKDNISKIRELLNTEALPQSTERKTGDISFAKEGIIDAIGHLLSDNMTVGVKNSEAYATIEIKHPVEVVNLNKEEGGHESYPFHLRQIDENGNKVKPILNVLGKSQHVTDILNDANNQRVEKKGGAGKFGSNQIGMAKGFVKLAAEQPTGVNMMTDATGKVYGFEQNGKIVLNADLMNGNTPFHEAGHLWLSWAKENRTDLHDAGMDKIKNSVYLKDVKNNKVYQENASKLPKGEREAYFMSEALAKAIGDNGEKFVTQAQKSDFKKWVKDLWETIATYFGLRDMSPEDISNMTLDEFSKRVVADIVGPESQKTGKEEVKVEEKTPVEFSIEEIYKELPKAKNLRETAQKNLINSNFDKIVEQLIKNDKIQKKC